MSLAILGLFAASILCDVFGQLAFKRGADRLPTLGDEGLGRFLRGLASEPWLLCGLAIYAVEFLVWMRLLALVPLAIAFPIASLNILGVMLASRLWLGEAISPRHYAGAALVTAGVALVATSL